MRNLKLFILFFFSIVLMAGGRGESLLDNKAFTDALLRDPDLGPKLKGVRVKPSGPKDDTYRRRAAETYAAILVQEEVREAILRALRENINVALLLASTKLPRKNVNQWLRFNRKIKTFSLNHSYEVTWKIWEGTAKTLSPALGQIWASIHPERLSSLVRGLSPKEWILVQIACDDCIDPVG